MAKIDNSNYHLLHLEFHPISITVVYKPPDSKSSSDIATDLKSILTKDKTSVVCGDFNIDFNKCPDNSISNTLTEMGFQQVISNSTHIEGSLLDHMYINTEQAMQFLHPLYFSDHDATCLLVDIE